MITFLLVLHLIVTLTLIATVLIQRSEGGGLGIGTTQGMGSFMSGRGTANLLTRTTSVLAALFMALSLALAVLNRGTAGGGRDILALPPAGHATTTTTTTTTATPTTTGTHTPAAPALVPPPKPKGPSVPTQ